MENRPHTLYCIVHRYYEFFKERYEISEIYKCKGKFGCDLWTDHVQQIGPNAYKRNILNTPCTYFNILYTEEVTNLERDEQYIHLSFFFYQLVADNFLFFKQDNMCVIKPTEFYSEFDE